MNIEEFEDIPSGTVLRVEGNERLRVLKPVSLKTCDYCMAHISGKSGKLTKGNATLLVLCPRCTISEVEK